jgi:GcrA cell cycle regulator
MEPSNWAAEHSDALRDYFLKGMSYAEIGREINGRFGTTYTRGAVIGRAKRMGLMSGQIPSPPLAPLLPGESPAVTPRRRQRRIPAWTPPPAQAVQPAKPIKLRCVGISPRLIPLLELASGDCRYPYGGDKEGDEIVFCGHPRQLGSSYCAPHARLTSGSGAASGRTLAAVVLRLVKAA